MNEVFLIGRVISDIDFRFIINSKNVSIVKFQIETLDHQVINTFALNDIADICYRKLHTNNIIVIRGKLRGDIVDIKEIELKAYVQ